MKEIIIYTDGACSGNPGRGGYAAVILSGVARKEISGSYRLTTNNRMEIMAAIMALSELKEPCQVTLYSDSQYLVNSMQLGWVKRWKANGWRRNRNDRAENIDLWEKMLKLCEIHQVKFVWIRGHNGNIENERCNSLSAKAIFNSPPAIDVEYERIAKT